MGHGPSSFRETDVTRALRAAKRAGVDVVVDLDIINKRMRLIPLKPGEANGTTDSIEQPEDLRKLL